MHYTNRLAQNQVGYVFQDIYDRHWIAWMLELFLQKYFAIVLTYLRIFNCILKIYRKRSMEA